MVDSTCDMVISNTNTLDYIDMNQKVNTTAYYHNYMALIKLRQRGGPILSRAPNGVFRCILEYCQPIILKRVTDHEYKNAKTIDYEWPQQISYQNPIRRLKGESYRCWWWFKLQSGEKTGKTASKDCVFMDLNWSQINSIEIRFD